MHLFSFDDCIILGYSLDSRTIWNWINFSFKSCLTTEREKQEEKGKSFLPLNLFSLTSEITYVITRVLTTFMIVERWNQQIKLSFF